MTHKQKLIELINRIRTAPSTNPVPAGVVVDRLIELLIDNEPDAPSLDPLEVGGRYELVIRVPVTVVDAAEDAVEVRLDQRNHQRSEDRSLSLDLDEISECRRVG